MTLVLRDRVLLRGRLVQVTVLGLITGSLFYNQVRAAAAPTAKPLATKLPASSLCADGAATYRAA